MTKNNTPNIVVKRIKKASKPRAFCLTVPSSPPPVKVEAALLFDGCIITNNIINKDTTINAITKALYKINPPYTWSI